MVGIVIMGIVCMGIVILGIVIMGIVIMGIVIIYIMGIVMPLCPRYGSPRREVPAGYCLVVDVDCLPCGRC